ncbi:MAG: hypothetical protein JNL28_08535 [Planctomycetes bacterium]|nr:hypothetical protein [Planctomycetota bacterium]
MLHTTQTLRVPPARRGIALYMTVVTVVVLAGMSVAVVTVGLAGQQQSRMTIARARALAAAEAAIGDAFVQIAASLPANIGTAAAPRSFADDDYYGTVVQNLDKTFTVTGVGRSGAARRALEVIVDPGRGGVFGNAIFAGNSSKDPAFALKFGGAGAQGDVVDGDVYSGGGVTFTKDAKIKGVPRATKTVTTTPTSIVATVPGPPPPPETGVVQPIPDIAGMNYAVNNDVNVAAAFASSTWASNAAGGSAWQLPKSNPAHIFRMNPSDRAANCSATTKNDYFLEDPHETVRADTNSDGTDPYRITVGNTADGGPSGNKKVYYIDGNLWIHNTKTMSFRLETAEASGLQVTFVVRGNIYMADNLWSKDSVKDGVAFIAMKDPAVADSGNVYFGDPSFGTLRHMAAFMYAENNFYDNNLNAAGSAAVELRGNMTAGNKVAINRDWGAQHSKLTVKYDKRVASGALTLPGLPGSSGVTAVPSIRVWREVGVPHP